MLCTGCGTTPAAVGRFCTRCDSRARQGSFERRRPLGGWQWQAVWGIDYGARAGDTAWRRWMHSALALGVVGMAVLLFV